MRLTKEDRAKIEQTPRQTRHKKHHIRLSVQNVLNVNFSHKVIAVSLGTDLDTRGNYKQKFVQKGLLAYLKDNTSRTRGT